MKFLVFSKKHGSALLLLLALLCAACGDRKSESKVQGGADSVVTPIVDNVPRWTDKDSTVYGRADGFGQSAFTLITADGRELDVALTSDEEGAHHGVIYGDREDTARYALTTRDDGENLGVMINLSQLDKFIKGQYEIYNCHLILKINGARDMVDIKELNDHVFVAKGNSGKIYKYKR